MNELFWDITKSVFSSFLVFTVHDFFSEDIFDFFNAFFRVGICWFLKHIYVYIIKKSKIAVVPLLGRGGRGSRS